MEDPDQSWYRPQIPRPELKALSARTDRAGLQSFGLWLVLLLVSGYVAYRSWGSWWAIPAFFVYGTLYSSSDARWHECAHGTPFRTRWLNECCYHLVILHDFSRSLSVALEPFAPSHLYRHQGRGSRGSGAATGESAGDCIRPA